MKYPLPKGDTFLESPSPNQKEMDVSPVPTISYVKAFKQAILEQPELFLVGTGVPGCNVDSMIQLFRLGIDLESQCVPRKMGTSPVFIGSCPTF